MSHASNTRDASASSDRSNEPPVDAIILAAGRGKRMQISRDPTANPDHASTGQADRPEQADVADARAREAEPMPKVLYSVADRSMIHWVLRACREAGVARCIVVVGFQGRKVRDALQGPDAPFPLERLHFVEQTEQLGTGHATRMAEPLFSADRPRDVFVLCGDGPLIRPATLRGLLAQHRADGAKATLATAMLERPMGYGRVLRDASGRFARIIEQRDATAQQLEIREVNPSYYCFRSDALFSTLGELTNDNAQGEYYVTDVPGLLNERGEAVSVIDAVPPEDVLSINTPEQLAEVDRLMRRRVSPSDEPLAP